MNTRNHSIDTWKGIAIISVIGIHACNVALSLPPHDHNHLIGLFFRTILNFAVALFFVFSGYFAPSFEEIKKIGVFKFYQRRLPMIWIPYLLWTGLYLALLNRSALLNPDELMEAIFLGRGIGVGYFVIVLTSLIVIHPLVGRIPRNHLLAASSTISVISVLVLYWAWIEYPNHRLIRFPSVASIVFLPWMVFYYYGFYLFTAKRAPLQKGAMLAAIALSLGMSFFESIWISSHLGLPQLAASQIKITSFFASLLISSYAIFYGVRFSDMFSFLAWAGKRSFALYLSHMLFLLMVTRYLNSVNWVSENQVLYIPIAVVATFAGASICIHISEKIFPAMVVRHVLGISKKANPGDSIK